jgi:hypothetical protein
MRSCLPNVSFAGRSRCVHKNPSGLGFRSVHTVLSAQRPAGADGGLGVCARPVTDLVAAVMTPESSAASNAEAPDWLMKSSPTLASAFVLIVATYQSLQVGLACLLVVACSGI